MLGAAIIVIVLVVVIPVSVILTGAAVAWILGWFLKEDVAKDYEGTEYLELGR